MDSLNDIKQDLPEIECTPAEEMVVYGSLKTKGELYKVFIDFHKELYMRGVLLIPYFIAQYETILLNEENMKGFHRNENTIIINGCPRLGRLELKCLDEKDTSAVFELLKQVGSSDSD